MLQQIINLYEHQTVIQKRVTYNMQCIVYKSFEIAIIKAVVSVARRTMENQFIGKSFCYVLIELKSSCLNESAEKRFQDNRIKLFYREFWSVVYSSISHCVRRTN